MNPLSLLLTGATGFLGRRLAPGLAGPWRVVGASRTASGPDSVALAVLLGRSAGSQIALAAAAERLPGSAWILDTHERLRQYMGGPPAEFPQLYDAASALGRAGKDFPPTLMIQGGRDYVFAGPCGQVSTYAIERFLAAVLHGT